MNTIGPILEQWRVCVEMANDIGQRRLDSNNLFIAINTGILAVFTFASHFNDICLVFLGIIVSIIWCYIIDSYKNLNEIKYQIVLELEKFLPATPFGYEWHMVKELEKYNTFSKLEKFIPIVFIAFYGFLLLAKIFGFGNFVKEVIMYVQFIY